MPELRLGSVHGWSAQAATAAVIRGPPTRAPGPCPAHVRETEEVIQSLRARYLGSISDAGGEVPCRYDGNTFELIIELDPDSACAEEAFCPDRPFLACSLDPSSSTTNLRVMSRGRLPNRPNRGCLRRRVRRARQRCSTRRWGRPGGASAPAGAPGQQRSRWSRSRECLGLGTRRRRRRNCRGTLHHEDRGDSPLAL